MPVSALRNLETGEIVGANPEIEKTGRYEKVSVPSARDKDAAVATPAPQAAAVGVSERRGTSTTFTPPPPAAPLGVAETEVPPEFV